jgi:hypothetical protein
MAVAAKQYLKNSK